VPSSRFGLAHGPCQAATAQPTAIEPLLLAITRVCTFAGQRALTNASGFFFERDERLFLGTSRHVVFDATSGHFPDRLEIELHVDPSNLGSAVWFSIPLYERGTSAWRQGADTGGAVDIAVVELNRSALPSTAHYRMFTPDHLPAVDDHVEIGSPLLIVCFPLGFHDTLLHLPVVRQASLASSFGLRFQGNGYF
jgi:hypothetical protein